MRKQIAKISALTILLLLGLFLVMAAYAQEPGDGEIVTVGGIGAAGLGDDPLEGFQTLYMFTGVYNKTVDPEFATALHCTNYAAEEVEVVVQFFDDSQGYQAGEPMPTNHTVTFTSQSIGSFEGEESAYAPDIQHGSGRVLVTDTPDVHVICTAQVLALNSNDVVTDASPLDIFQP